MDSAGIMLLLQEEAERSSSSDSLLFARGFQIVLSAIWGVEEVGKSGRIFISALI